MNWGPHAWTFLHYLTFNYPDNPTPEEQQDAELFFTSLKSLLPCDECKTNFVNELELFPIDTRSKFSLSNWLVNVHNSINNRLHKPLMTYAQATKIYDKECKQCKNKNFIKSRSQASSNFSKGVMVLMFLSFIFVAVILLQYYFRRLRQ